MGDKKRGKWVRAFWVDESWQYPADTRAEIVEIVGEDAAAHVTEFAQAFQAMLENERERPSKGVIKKELALVRDTSLQVQQLFNLDQRTLDELDKRLPPEDSASDHIATLQALSLVLFGASARAHSDYSARGAPRKDAPRWFVHRLAGVWHQAFGESPSRTYEPATGTEGGRFAQFVRVCVRDLPGFDSGLDDLIREAIYRQKK